MSDRAKSDYPKIRAVGLAGLVVSFGDALGEAANRAALAFRGAVEAAGLDGVEEVSTSLVSTFVRFDPLSVSFEQMNTAVQGLLGAQDWYAAALPEGRRLWVIPTAFEVEVAPDLAEAAKAAGMSVEAAINSLTQSPVHVQTIGFAPGQPYLGQLPPEWDIPRRSQLNPNVPVGALTVAIRQFVLFSVESPTGWWHVGQTAFQCFRPDQDDPFALRPGDEIRFERVRSDDLVSFKRAANGGARWEAIG